MDLVGSGWFFFVGASSTFIFLGASHCVLAALTLGNFGSSASWRSLQGCSFLFFFFFSLFFLCFLFSLPVAFVLEFRKPRQFGKFWDFSVPFTLRVSFRSPCGSFLGAHILEAFQGAFHTGHFSELTAQPRAFLERFNWCPGPVGSASPL